MMRRSHLSGCIELSQGSKRANTDGFQWYGKAGLVAGGGADSERDACWPDKNPLDRQRLPVLALSLRRSPGRKTPIADICPVQRLDLA